LVECGKITKEEIDNVVKLANVDFETTKNLFNKIGVVKAISVSNVIDLSVTTNGTKKGWSIRDYEKKDPTGLLKIKNETPDVYNQLYKEFYGNSPK
jgi:hypothetical protein